MSNSDNEQKTVDTDFGSVLSEARKAQNYTVDDISEHLKIPSHTISEIEANDLDALPAPTFTQGYIRVYAKFLEISEEDVLDKYNAAVPHENSTGLRPRSNLPGEASSQSPVVKMITILLIIAGITAVLYGSFQYYQEKADVMEGELESKAPSFTGSSLDSPTDYSAATRGGASDESDTLESASESAADSGAEVAAMVDSDMPAAAPVAEPDSIPAEVEAEQIARASAEPAAEQDILEIYAEQGSWMKVRDATQARLFYNMVPVGGSKTLTGKAPFRITLGNAKTTRLVLNEIEIDISGYISAKNTVTIAISTDGQNVIFH